MKTIRLLIPVILLSLAAPAFAICGYCGGPENNTCTFSPGLGTSCRYKHFICYSLCVEGFDSGCSPSPPSQSFGSEYRILSVTVEDEKASLAKNESAVIPPKKLKKTT